MNIKLSNKTVYLWFIHKIVRVVFKKIVNYWNTSVALPRDQCSPKFYQINWQLLKYDNINLKSIIQIPLQIVLTSTQIERGALLRKVSFWKINDFIKNWKSKIFLTNNYTLLTEIFFTCSSPQANMTNVEQSKDANWSTVLHHSGVTWVMWRR